MMNVKMIVWPNLKNDSWTVLVRYAAYRMLLIVTKGLKRTIFSKTALVVVLVMNSIVLKPLPLQYQQRRLPPLSHQLPMLSWS